MRAVRDRIGYGLIIDQRKQDHQAASTFVLSLEVLQWGSSVGYLWTKKQKHADKELPSAF